MPENKLIKAVDSYMSQVPMVHEHCDRCLAGQRWQGNAVVMVVDAAFDSIGLNYFQAVVPKVELFRRRFVLSGEITTFEDLVAASTDALKEIWKNARSWHVAREISAYFSKVKRNQNLTDHEALFNWSKNAPLDGWQSDPIGAIKGVGINTYQYLRMMGGADTIMPDKIVKRVIRAMLKEAEIELPSDDLEFVRKVERIAPQTGYRAIELCWMTWLIQSEAGLSRTEKYADLLPLI